MKAKIWILAALLFTTLGFSVPELRIITGRVTSAEDGSPLPDYVVTEFLPHWKSSLASTLVEDLAGPEDRGEWSDI